MQDSKFLHNGSVHVISKGRHKMSNPESDILDSTSDRNARCWYLIVIVLLYVGLITSFCLNVSLLLKKTPETAAPVIILAQEQSGFHDMDGN